MANYTLNILRNKTVFSSRELAIEALNKFEYHMFGQPLSLLYRSSNGVRLLFAVGIKNYTEQTDTKCGEDFYEIINDSDSTSSGYWDTVVEGEFVTTDQAFAPTKLTKEQFNEILSSWSSDYDDKVFFVTSKVGDQDYGLIYKGNKLQASGSYNDLVGEFEIDGEVVTGSIQDALNKVVEVIEKETGLISDITATGVGSVGGIKEGDVLTAGTSFQQVMEKLLIKEIDVTTTLPNVKLNYQKGPYEIGSSVNLNLSSSYTDGYYTQPWNGQKINASCTPFTTTYYKNNTVVTSPDQFTVSNTTYTYKVITDYDSSTVVPKTNLGNDSTQTITEGSCSNSGSLQVGYKYFVGSTTEDPTTMSKTEIRSLTSTGFILSTVSWPSLTFPSSEYAVFAVPEGYKVTARDSMDLGDISFETTAINAVGLDGKTYKVYYIFNAASDQITYIKINITKDV